MEQLQIPDKTPKDVERFYRQMFDSAQGVILDLDAVPTGDALQAGQIGRFGTDIYLVSNNGTKVKLSGSSWS